MTCEEFREISGTFALGAVTPQEAAEARAHLQTCANCTREWQELRAAVDLLPLAVTQVSPRGVVKEQLLVQVLSEPRYREVTPLPVNEVGQQRARKLDMGRVWLAAAALFLLFVCIGMSVWNVALRGQMASQDTQITALGQRSGGLEQQVGTLRKQITLAFSMNGMKDMAGATGKLFYIPQDNLTVVVIQGLPKPRGAEVYQGWLIQNKKPTSMGLLFMQNGQASLTYHGTIVDFDLAAISLEPGPTASLNAPVGPVIATGQLKPTA